MNRSDALKLAGSFLLIAVIGYVAVDAAMTLGAGLDAALANRIADQLRDAGVGR